MRACLLAVLLLVACTPEPSSSAASRQGPITVALPSALISELQARAERDGAPVSTLLADAWDAHGAMVRLGLTEGYFSAPDYSHADRQPLSCWFDDDVNATLQTVAAQTGVDRGALLTMTWRRYAPRAPLVFAQR